MMAQSGVAESSTPCSPILMQSVAYDQGCAPGMVELVAVVVIGVEARNVFAHFGVVIM